MSLLCGFLGAGKTTMMKHILETKHEDPAFRCAVIVNDMAALNIDKSLIDQSAVVQSDGVVAMQNGCFCCTLQSDLVDQIISLTRRRQFNYMLIEASGVSEPPQIAPKTANFVNSDSTWWASSIRANSGAAKQPPCPTGGDGSAPLGPPKVDPTPEDPGYKNSPYIYSGTDLD